MHDVSPHVRQPEVAARVAVRELLMVKPHQMQHRGMQIVDMNAILDSASGSGG